MRTARVFQRLIPTCLLAIAMAPILSGCAGSTQSNLPRGEAAYAIVPPLDPASTEQLYRLSPGDTIRLDVFDEPDLSIEKAQLDESGNIQLPLVGSVSARGLTSVELSGLIRDLLAARYIRDPKVVVGVVQRSEQFVSVEGQVEQPGVFPVDRNATLLTAIARAESPTKTAKLDEVIVFRTVGNRRMGAVFNLNDIRSGRAPDPPILGGDVVVVGYSNVKGVYRDFLLAAPLFNLFVLF